MILPPDSVVDTITGDVVKISDYTGYWYSASLVKDGQDCMAKAFARITKQPQINPGIALINGSAAHWGMEVFFKANGDADPVKAYNDYFKAECEKQKFDWRSAEAEEKRLEGEKMVAASAAEFAKNGFVKTVNPELVERKFRVMRAGRMFVGKIDLLHFLPTGGYAYVDLKTGKYAPKGSQQGDVFRSYELDSDVQFNVYPWAAYNDPNLPTYEIWPDRGVWFHMRGKNVNVGPDGKVRRETKKDPDSKPLWKFDFPTRPTQESVEQIFRDTIDPVCGDIEDGRWKRNRSDMCAYCNWYDKKNEKCKVDLPIDGLAERPVQIDLIERAA